MNTIMITGANRGIGLGLVKAYLKLGWRVLACCRAPDKAHDLIELKEESKKELKKETSDNLLILKLEAESEEDINSLSEKLSNDTLLNNTIDILINNAAILTDPWDGNTYFQLGTLTRSAMLESFNVNSVSPLLITQALLKPLSRSSKPIVINITSIAGSISNNKDGGLYAYRASKAALNAITKNLAIELHDKKFTVIALHPGWTKTEMGTDFAQLSIDESIPQITQLISRLKFSDSGKFLTYSGEELDW